MRIADVGKRLAFAMKNSRALGLLAVLGIGLVLVAVIGLLVGYLKRHPDQQFALGFAVGAAWLAASLVAVVRLALGYWGWARHPRRAIYGTVEPRGAARVWSKRLATTGGYLAGAGLLIYMLLYGGRGRGFATWFPAIGKGWWLAITLAAALMALAMIVLPGLQAWANYLYLRFRPSVVTEPVPEQAGLESVRVVYRPSLGFNGTAQVTVDGVKRGALSAGGALGLYLTSGDHDVTVSFVGAFSKSERSTHLCTAPNTSCDIFVSSGLLWAVGLRRYGGERQFRQQRTDLSSPVAIPDIFAKRRPGRPREAKE